jgi:hypothetical protein
MRAFFSKRGAELYGTAIYARADGTEIEVTAVVDLKQYPDSILKWPDLEDRGEVERYLRKGTPGSSLLNKLNM